MKTKITVAFISLLASIVLISCGPTSENAKKYDDQLVDNLAKVYSKENILIEAISKKTPETLDELYEDLTGQIDSSIAEVEKMETFDGKTDLRDAAIRVFSAYKDALTTDYKDLISLSKIPDSLYTPENDDKKMELCKKIDEKINKTNNEFLELEKAFKGKYKIEITIEAMEPEEE